MFKNLDEKDKHEFKPAIVEIEDRPVNPLGRAVLWIILSVITFGSLWLFLAKVDVVISARGKFIPTGEIKILQPIETGVISKILVKEGDEVKKGDILMQIDPSVTQTNLETKKRDLELLGFEIIKLKALIDEREITYENNSSLFKLQKNLFTNKKESFERQLKLLNEQHNQVIEQLNSIKTDKIKLSQLLQNEQEKEQRLKKVLDLIAKNEYTTVQNTIIDHKENIKKTEFKIKELKSKLNEIAKQKKLNKSEFKSKLLEELTIKKKESNNIKAEIKSIHFRNKKQSIISPVDGYIAKLLVHTIGGVVTPAEKVISIVPKNAPLIIKAEVQNKDIGFIKKGMEVAIKIDTFDFQKYGLVEGTVKHIINDAIEDEKKGLYYEIYVIPKQNYLIIEKEKKLLTSGMGVTAELKVGKRRVIEFFIYPLIKYLDEGVSVR